MHINELTIRKIVRMVLKETESTAKADLSMPTDSSGISDKSKKPEEKTGEEYDDQGPIHVKNPVKILGGRYRREYIPYVEEAMDNEGITNKFMRIAILAVIGKEGHFKLKPESSYANTDTARLWYLFGAKFRKNSKNKEKLRSIFGNRFDNRDIEKSDTDLWKIIPDPSNPARTKRIKNTDRIQADDVKFYELIYGGKYGNNKYGDGYKYRGKGFNQLTFKGSYKKRAAATGIPIDSNPEMLEKPRPAAKVAITFILNRLKRHAPDYNSVTDQDTANTYAARANAGWGRTGSPLNSALASTNKHSKNFSYD